MGHLNDVIVAAGLVGVPTLTTATIALAIYGHRRGAGLYRKYNEADTGVDAGIDIDTVLDQTVSEKTVSEKTVSEKTVSEKAGV